MLRKFCLALLASLATFGTAQASYLFDANGENIKNAADDAFTDIGLPITIGCWYKATNWTDGFIIGVGASRTSINTSIQLEAEFGPPDVLWAIPTTSGGTSSHTAGATVTDGTFDNTWVWLAGTFTSDTLREATIDSSANQASSTTSVAVAATLDNVSIGNNMAAGTDEASGLVAECAVWKVVLSDTELNDLGNGLSPACVQNDGDLLDYWPLSASNATQTGTVGGIALAVTGATFDADHPTITGCSGSGLLSRRRR